MTNPEEQVLSEFPPEWLDDEIMSREVPIAMSLQAASIIHGLIRLALKHPTVPEISMRVGTDFKKALEFLMEAGGLPPPHRGWDADSAWSCPLCKEDLQESPGLDVIYCKCGYSSMLSEFLKKQGQVT